MLNGPAILGCVKRIPRAAAMLVLTLEVVALHAALPFELSRLGGRMGRSGKTRPAVRAAGLPADGGSGRGVDGVGGRRPLRGRAAGLGAAAASHTRARATKGPVSPRTRLRRDRAVASASSRRSSPPWGGGAWDEDPPRLRWQIAGCR